jgi:hypothetical protein
MITEVMVATAGISLIIWRKEFSEGNIQFQKKQFRIKFNENEMRGAERISVIFGIIIIAFAVMMYLKAASFPIW